MIAKSDLIILVVSSTLLSVAVYRWDQNTRDIDASANLVNAPIAPQAEVAQNDSPLNQTLEIPLIGETGANSVTSVVTTEAVSVEPVVLEPVRSNQVHVVRSGDSLSEIAASYNTSVQTLRDLNGISGSTIFIGQEILYPSN